MASPDVASPEEYLIARNALLEKEKAATRTNDAIAKERRALPLVEVTKEYTFIDADTQKSVTLSELFQGRKQLVVCHAMFDPAWEHGCQYCSLLLDHIPPLDHLHGHDTSLAVISLAPAPKIAKYKAKLQYTRFPWLSSYGTSFNADYNVTMTTDATIHNTGGVSNDVYNFRTAAHHIAHDKASMTKGEQPGHSVFVRGGPLSAGGVGRGEQGKIYHSYSSYARAGEAILGTSQWLSWTVLGQEGGEYRRRGEYET